MRTNAIPRETLYSQLRASGYLNLGQVRTVYLEPSGKFSVIPSKEIRPGLSLVPLTDDALHAELQVTTNICASCGARWKVAACRHCGSTTSVAAVLDRRDAS